MYPHKKGQSRSCWNYEGSRRWIQTPEISDLTFRAQALPPSDPLGFLCLDGSSGRPPSPQNTQRRQELTTNIREQILGQLWCFQLQVTENFNSKYNISERVYHLTYQETQRWEERTPDRVLQHSSFSLSGFLRAAPLYVLAGSKMVTEVSRHHSWMKKRDHLFLGYLLEVRKPFPKAPCKFFFMSPVASPHGLGFLTLWRLGSKGKIRIERNRPDGSHISCHDLASEVL